MTTSFRSPAGVATVFSTDQKIRVGNIHSLRSSRTVFLGRNVFGGVHSLPPSSSSSSSIKAISTPAKPEAAKPTKRSKVEIIKENSNFIRYPLNEELLTESPNVNESAVQLIKFHGSYQQYNREERGGRSYSFMLRTKNPSGKVPNQLYLTMDDLADEFGIGTLRLTTRQTFQLHGVLKQNLKTVMSSIIKNMGSTLGACGDLNRNVLAPAAPYAKRDYLFAQETADNIAALLSPQSGFYYDMWVDGEQFMTAEAPEVVEARNDNSHGTNFVDSPEPIYGTQFLPRKFKIAVTVPTDNSVDLLTNDIGVVVVSDENGEPQGFNIYVGGGMGRTHRMESTFARIAEPLGYVPKEDILYAVKAIVVTQREHGRRDDRKYSRMKYLLSSWGIEKFRDVVEQYYGKKFEPPRDLPEWEFKSYLGWHEQGDGAWFCGLHVDSGRVGGNMKKTLREVIEKYRLDVRITPNQNIVLCDIKSEWKRSITTVLAQAGLLQPEFVDPLNQTAMACPAFPLCPLAITEAERGIPSILKRVRAMFEKVGLEYDESVVVRVTGCPNGCANELICLQISNGSYSGIREILEEFFSIWVYKDDHYILDDAKLNVKGLHGKISLGIDEFMEAVELYTFGVLGKDANDVDLAISWVEKAALPEETRQGLLRRLHSLLSLKSANVPVAASFEETSSYDVLNNNKSFANDEVDYVLKLSKKHEPWSSRPLSLRLGNTRFSMSRGRVALGLVGLIICYALKRKRAALVRIIRRQMESTKKAIVDFWKLAFSYQVNPLAAIQSIPSTTT